MIHVLPKHISDKIAAGEVVERPVSIVKELVENSIDAGATAIVVEIKNGGKTYLRVTDNGFGIPSDQVVLAFQRHATSKISEAEDLNHIYTLGFRGEALSSIAAVSRTEIVTKEPAEKAGTRVVIEGGEVVSQSVTGCPDGTTIIVRDLFYNTPARLKFLKPDATESAPIIDFVSQMALAYPNIRFRMINNEQALFSTLGNGDRLQGIHTLYGRINGSRLLFVEADSDGYRIEGYISDPGEHRSNRKSQIFFVNGRVISNKPMERALDKAYAQRLFEGRHPIAYLFLDVPAEDLDVNIHPNKREVRFHREGDIETFIHQALGEALQQRDAIPRMVQEELPRSASVAIAKSAFKENKSQAGQEPRIHQQVDIKSLLSNLRQQQEIIAEETIAVDSVTKSATTPASKCTSASKITSTPQPTGVHAGIQPDAVAGDNRFHPETLSPMGVAFGTYILATDDDTLYLIDQHAAHERILFEQIFAQMNSAEKVRQAILVPFTVQCSLSEGAVADHWLQALDDMGYSMESFGPNTYIVKEIPGFLSYEESRRFISDFLDHISEERSFSDPKLLQQSASSACKAAVKGREHLSPLEIDQLLIRLGQCENPLSCPHGRPTFIQFPHSEIQRKFRRT
jgi:DNA mismatch repair protein MutL